MAPKGFLTAASEGVFRALFLAPFPAAPGAALAGALPPAFPGARSATLAAAGAGALEAPSGAAPCTAIEAALEVHLPVRVQPAVFPVSLSVQHSALCNLTSAFVLVLVVSSWSIPLCFRPGTRSGIGACAPMARTASCHWAIRWRECRSCPLKAEGGPKPEGT